MSDARTLSALERTNAAIERISNILSERHRAGPASGDIEKVQKLEARHEKLKQETASALAEIDHLIQQNQRHAG